jgi:hypothetical protein
MSPISRRTWPRSATILWFPVLFAIAVPIVFTVAFHQPKPHDVPIALVGGPGEVERLTGELERVSPGGFDVHARDSAAVAAAAVRERTVDAAYVTGNPGVIYLAPAASAIRANYLQATFTRIAARSGARPPASVDVVPLASGDAGNSIFFFVFPLMMIGLITSIVLLQLPAWGIGQRMAMVAATGALGSLVAYTTATSLNALPGKPLLLLYAFLVTQLYGQLMVGAAPLLKQFFLPVAMSWALVLSVPSSGGTVPPDFLPAFFRVLSHVLPLAQAVAAVRGVAYFHGRGIAQATLVLGLWAALAVSVLSIARMRVSRAARVGGGDPAAKREDLVATGGGASSPT